MESGEKHEREVGGLSGMMEKERRKVEQSGGNGKEVGGMGVGRWRNRVEWRINYSFFLSSLKC